MSFFLSLMIIVLIQAGVNAVLTYLNVPTVYIEMILNLILAVIFSYWNYRRFDRREAVKDISFHISICTWYAILTGISAFSMMLY